MTRHLMELRPSSIHDINAMVALYRPGPMESIPRYIERKHNPSLVTYLDPRMKDILAQSYGVITYQDDVLLIAIHLAGYSWLEADKLRKAMGKKIPAVMEAEKEKLKKGLVKNGMSIEKSEQLWLLIEPFAAYGFNKCLTGDTRIIDVTTGHAWTIRDLYASKQTISVHTLNDTLRFESQQIEAVIKNGIKPVYQLRTRSGRTIKATANHPFYTINGWKKLDELMVHTRIAVPRVLRIPGTDVESYKAATLGYLLAEGNFCHPYGVYFYSKNEDEIADFLNCAKQFDNAKPTLDRSKPATAVYIGQIDKRKGNTLKQWSTKLGLSDKTATKKFVPNEVFTWDTRSLAIFLGKLWQGDGAVNIKGTQLFYATSSVQLSHDVQHLLLRLGILSTIHTKKFRYRGGIKPGFTVNISHRDNIECFAKTAGVYLIGKKKRQLDSLQTISSRIALRGEHPAIGIKNTIPADILIDIREAMFAHAYTPKTLSCATGLAPRLFMYDQKKLATSVP